MFERFTEQARRTIFFARYEASSFGCPYIELDHMLLGLLRESRFVRDLLQPDAAASLREQLRAAQDGREKVSTSVDLPLAHTAKRMLAYGAEEAESLRDEHIDNGHLFAGLLRTEPSATHAFLREQAGDRDRLLETVRKSLEGESHRVRVEATLNRHAEPAINWLQTFSEIEPAPEFAGSYERFLSLVERSGDFMQVSSETFGNAKLHRRPWTRKQALVLLIDWADQYRLWLGEALRDPVLHGLSFPSEEGVATGPYSDMPWRFVVESWTNANCLLIRLIAAIPAEKAQLPCRIGIEQPIPLLELLDKLLDKTEDILEQVLARL